MAILESLRMAFLNLSYHKLRSALTMLGMIFGVAAVLAILSIGAGAEREALAVIQRMGLRNIIVQARDFDREELRVLRQDSPGLSLEDMEALERLLPAGTIFAARKELDTSQIWSTLGKADSRVLGITSNYLQVLNLQVVEGTSFIPVDERHARQFCVLGTTARRKLFGLSRAVGEIVKIDREWFTVIGVLSDQELSQEEFERIEVENPNNNVYIPLQTLLRKFEPDPVQNQLDEIIVHTPEGSDLGELSAIISGMMASMHRQIGDFSMVVPERLLNQSRQTRRIFNIVMGAIASISLLVGGIGIMNIMLASVLERTSEIGLRRALGARKRDISLQFVLEAVTISASGAALGVLTGFGMTRVVASYSGWSTIVTASSILLGVSVSVSVGLLFGIYPARRAASVSPVEALRYE